MKIHNLFLIAFTTASMALISASSAEPLRTALPSDVSSNSSGAAAREEPVWLARTMQADADAERGCCVIPSSGVKCAAANRGYCRTKAEQAHLAYEFHPNVACSSLAQCR